MRACVGAVRGAQKARREPLADDELNALLARTDTELAQFRTLDVVNSSAQVRRNGSSLCV